MKASQADVSVPLAWAGWRTRVPADWRPLRIAGGWAEGSMVAGDAERSCVQLNWQRPRGRHFDAGRLLERWKRRCGVRKAKALEGGPRSQAFAASAGFMLDEPGKAGLGVRWCGCAPGAGLVVEVRTGGDLPAASLAAVRESFLASLDVTLSAAPCEWAVFSARFLSPPGFVYRMSTLNLGDVSLLFGDADGRRLRLRQVYPADLALARRSIEDWLEDSRLRGKLRRGGQVQTRPLELAADADLSLGQLHAGSLRLPWLRVPWRAFADGVVLDGRRNRLLYAGLDGRGRGIDRAIVEAALRGMAGVA